MPAGWRLSWGPRSKYVPILPASVAAPPQEEFSQLLRPVKLGPAQLRSLWANVEGLFSVPEGWTQTEKDAWIQAQRASGSQREKVKSHDLESFIQNLNLKGLLDDLTICFDQTLKRANSEVTRKRFLQINVPERGVPEVSINGDPDWHSNAARMTATFFENEKSRAAVNRAFLLASGVAVGLSVGGLVALVSGWILGLLLGILLAVIGLLLMQGAAVFLIPNSRLYVDDRSGKPGFLYDWGAQIVTGVISGLIMYVLLWASGHV